ncbi:MAG: von Willebrand factor type A domain-containing protein [Deltaproteobacteria bacterium]|nr:von Willebrand factor type A domain-containing protein [Deltaproteobacteria bacterium]
MKKSDIEKLLKDMNVPLPDDKKKDESIKAAMEEFDAAKKRSKAAKAFEDEERPTGINKFFGGIPVMKALTGMAAAVLVLVVGFAFIMPQFKSGKIVTVASAPAEVDVKRPSTVASAPEAKQDAPLRYPAGDVGKQVSVPPSVAVAKSAPPVPADKEIHGVVAPKADFAAGEGRGDISMDEMATESMDAKVSSAAPFADSRAKVGLLAKKEKVAGDEGRHYLMSPSTVPVEAKPQYYKDEGRNKFEHKEINPVKVAKDEPVSTFSIDVDTASYAFVRRSIREGHWPQADAVRTEELINYFDYDYELPGSRSKPFLPNVSVMPSPWDKDKKLVHIGIKGYDIVSREKPRANLVFLVDVSGSMNSPDKLPLLVSSLKLLVGELDKNDTVAIAVYAGAAGVVLEPTKAAEKTKIYNALERLQAGGSTAGGAGLKLAYSLAEENFDKKAVNRVILATDGDFNVGITNTNELQSYIENKRETGVYLSVLGFGEGNYNDELMQKLAHYGNGNAAYIDTIDEARKALVEEAASTLFTIANDVKIQIEFNPAMVAEYRLIGYETRMLNREDFRNDKVDAGDIGSGHAVTAIYEITPVGSKAALVEPLRYGSDEGEGKKISGNKTDYAYLRLRYKVPGEKTGRELEKAITVKDEARTVEAAPVESRFAASVAAFGEILKGGRYTGDYTLEDVARLAASSKGEDKSGYRAEFVKLVKLAAKTAK